MMTDKAHITIANKYEIIWRFSAGIIAFALDPF